jgi:hypothetical protein
MGAFGRELRRRKSRSRREPDREVARRVLEAGERVHSFEVEP